MSPTTDVLDADTSTDPVRAGEGGSGITLWGRASSSNVQKVLWCCDELGLTYDQVYVGREFGGNDQPWYLEMNPMGLVPTLGDGDLTIWESNTILR
jgi:glutathione S-transferase